MSPQDRRYTAEHEWIHQRDDAARVGITDFAQESLGDVVFVSLPTVGDQVTKGQSLGEVESTKSVSEIYAPFDGEVVSCNTALEATPELVNTDPYEQGWIVTLRPRTAADLDGLLTAEQYDASLVGH